MEHQIKALAEAVGSPKLKKLILSHVKELLLENKHLIIFVDTAAALHEICEKRMDETLRKGLEKTFDPSITYEVRLSHNVFEKSDHTQFEAQNKKGH